MATLSAPLPAAPLSRRRAQRAALALLPLALLLLAGQALHRELAGLPAHSVREAMGALGPRALALALGLTSQRVSTA